MVATEGVLSDVGPDPVGPEPVFGLASHEQLVSLRVGGLDTTPTYEAVLAALQAVEDGDEAMAAFTEANRDLLDYRFLYRLTSEKLRAHYAGRADEEGVLSAARARAVKAAQRFDTPLFKQVGEAETRLGGLLALYMQGKRPTAADAVVAAGETPQAIFTFWLVLLAAIAAWEAKLPVAGQEAQARDKLADLSEIRAAVESNDALLVRGGIAPVHTLLATSDALDAATGELRAPDHAAARAMLPSLAPEALERLLVIRRVGCAYCQVQRHGFQAYNPITQRIATLYDFLLYGKFQPLEAVDLERPPREIDSNFVKMANEADKIVQEAGIDIPLFW